MRWKLNFTIVKKCDEGFPESRFPFALTWTKKPKRDVYYTGTILTVPHKYHVYQVFISLCYVRGTIEYLICNPKKDKENPNKQHKEDFNDVFLV